MSILYLWRFAFSYALIYCRTLSKTLLSGVFFYIKVIILHYSIVYNLESCFPQCLTMFNRQRESAKITKQEPSFKVRYIGCIETFVGSGKGCTNIPVQKLWDNSAEEQYLKRVQLRIKTDAIHMRDLDSKQNTERVFKIENISFCNVECVVNDKIFSWICKDDEDGLMYCYAVMCSNTEKARAIALVLSRAFQIAYKEWKANKSRVKREVEKSTRKASIAKMPLSKRDSKSFTKTMASFSETGSSIGSTTAVYVVNAQQKDATHAMRNHVDKSLSHEIGIQAVQETSGHETEMNSVSIDKDKTMVDEYPSKEIGIQTYL